jgi:hypothetical protein
VATMNIKRSVKKKSFTHFNEHSTVCVKSDSMKIFNLMAPESWKMSSEILLSDLQIPLCSKE